MTSPPNPAPLAEEVARLVDETVSLIRTDIRARLGYDYPKDYNGWEEAQAWHEIANPIVAKALRVHADEAIKEFAKELLATENTAEVLNRLHHVIGEQER